MDPARLRECLRLSWGRPGDLYQLVGERFYGRPITAEERRDIKAILYGYIYGGAGLPPMVGANLAEPTTED